MIATAAFWGDEDLENYEFLAPLDLTAGASTAYAYAVKDGKGQVIEADTEELEGCGTTLKNCFELEALSPEKIREEENRAAVLARDIYSSFAGYTGVVGDVHFLKTPDKDLSAQDFPALKQGLELIHDRLWSEAGNMNKLGDKNAELNAKYDLVIDDLYVVKKAQAGIRKAETLARYRVDLIEGLEEGPLGYHEQEQVRSVLTRPPSMDMK